MLLFQRDGSFLHGEALDYFLVIFFLPVISGFTCATKTSPFCPHLQDKEVKTAVSVVWRSFSDT